MFTTYLPKEIGTAFSGTADFLIRVLVESGSNSISRSILDYTSPIISTTAIDIGERVIVLGSIHLGTGTL